MSAAILAHPAGTAWPLLSGGYAVDMGDQFPVIVPDRDRARALLDTRTAQTSAARRDLGKAVGPVGRPAADLALPHP